MKRKFANWIKLALLAPLAGAYATGGCSPKVLRQAADALDEAAYEIDGEDGEEDFGEWLADEVRDW